ncbi:MAG: DNA-binding response regulator [Planctomycetota bacterium]|nr:MAG: DNA-binding response regulator [Planctomycetota bacterium]
MMSPNRSSGPTPKPLTALLVDDEPHAVERLTRLLSVHPEIVVVATASSAAEARQLLTAAPAHGVPGALDVVFLDVEMPGENGLAVLESVAPETVVVFVTAYPKYAIQAFGVGALDYLLKPVDPDRLEQSVDRILKQTILLRDTSAGIAGDDDHSPVASDQASPHSSPSLSSDTTAFVACATGGRIERFQISDIAWIEGLRNYTRVGMRSPQRDSLFRQRLGKWQADLPTKTFVRLGKSLLVNVTILEKIQWRSRDETLLTFVGRSDSITIARLATIRLRQFLESPPP